MPKIQYLAKERNGWDDLPGVIALSLIHILYMFDGQNVFFDEDATFGKSWGVADYLDYTDTPLILSLIHI